MKNSRLRQGLPISINDRAIFPFREGLFSRNFAKFHENKVLTKISQFMVLSLFLMSWLISLTSIFFAGVKTAGIMTRTRTGTVKPKQFDGEKFITPVKRKASTPAVTPVLPTEVKRVKVVPEVILEPPEPVGSPEKEEKGNNPSDSESDLAEAADKADKKLTVSSNKI